MKSDFQGFLDNNHRIVAKVCRIYTDQNDDFNDYYQDVDNNKNIKLDGYR